MGQIERRRFLFGSSALVAASLAALAFVVGLTSCAEVPVASAGSTGATPVASAGRAFGRVRVVQDGKEIEFDLFADRLSLYVRSQRSGDIEKIDFTAKRGTFNWVRPAGEYVIVAYSILTQHGRLWLTFSVPGPGEAAYIGDLHIDSSTSGGYRWAVRDAYADAVKDFEAAFTKEGLVPKVALMKPEAMLGKYRRVTNICAASEWGIECDRSHQGVKPLSPDQGTLQYPQTNNLKPRLAWSPVGGKDVTYDVAVYESISSRFTGVDRMRGALVLYAEALREPFFQIETPLLPGKRHEWSVRLRRGDSVSNWSTTGYVAFVIVGVASGSGYWFGFTTPER